MNLKIICTSYLPIFKIEYCLVIFSVLLVTPELAAQQPFDLEQIRLELSSILGNDWGVKEGEDKENTLLVVSNFLVWRTGEIGSQFIEDLEEGDKTPYVIRLDFGPKLSFQEYVSLCDKRTKILNELYSQDQTKDRWRKLQMELSRHEPPKYITSDYAVYLTPFDRSSIKLHPTDLWRKCDIAHQIIARYFGRIYAEID